MKQYLIAVFLLLTIGLGGCEWNKSNPELNNPEVVNTNEKLKTEVIIEEEEFVYQTGAILEGSGLVYRNEEYGFQLTMPATWSGYKILYYGQKSPMFGIVLPTKATESYFFEADPRYCSRSNVNCTYRVEGYSMPMRIRVVSLEYYNELLNCEDPIDGPSCRMGIELIGSHDKYGFMGLGTTAELPEDVGELWRSDGDIRKPKPLFELIKTPSYN